MKFYEKTPSRPVTKNPLRMSPEEFSRLCTAIEQNKTPSKSLNISRLMLGEQKDISRLFRALEKNTTITELNMADNGFTDDHAEHIKNLLTKNKNIRVLNLGGEDLDSSGKVITNEGVRIIAEVLKDSSIKSLILNGNLIDDEGAIYLRDALESNGSLTELKLPSDTGIDNDILKDINDLIRSNRKIAIKKTGAPKMTRKQFQEMTKEKGDIADIGDIPKGVTSEIASYLNTDDDKTISTLRTLLRVNKAIENDKKKRTMKIGISEGKELITKKRNKTDGHFVDNFLQPSPGKLYDDLKNGVYLLKGGKNSNLYLKSNTTSSESGHEAYYLGIEKKGGDISLKEICYDTAENS